MKAVLIESVERFTAFRSKLEHYGVECDVLSFKGQEWITYDYAGVDFLIHYPSFQYSDTHPLALQEVRDNLVFIQETFPHLKIYPDPRVIRYYNDKYRQFLFLETRDYPIPETIPLLSRDAVDLAESRLGYPMVVKNRFGAGGGSVFRITRRADLMAMFRMSQMDLFHRGAAARLLGMISKRMFYYLLIKARNMQYPFFSSPLLAQKFITIDRDLKTVTGDGRVVEAHWRLQANKNMWKTNIDDGGIGVWGNVPQEALDLSVRLADDLGASWLNIDLMVSDGRFLISEFSPVWHHYAYREKESFVYEDDYNLDTPLEVSLDLERIIVESLIRAAENRK